jgi:hypothetical protein
VPNRAVRGGQSVQIPGAQDPDYVAHVFVSLCSIIISRLYQLTPTHQPQVTLQRTVSQSFRFSVEIFSRSPFRGGGTKKVFFCHRAPTLSGAEDAPYLIKSACYYVVIVSHLRGDWFIRSKLMWPRIGTSGGDFFSSRETLASEECSMALNNYLRAECCQ